MGAANMSGWDTLKHENGWMAGWLTLLPRYYSACRRVDEWIRRL